MIDTHHHCLLLLLGAKANTHFTISQRVEGWFDRSTAVRVCNISSVLHWLLW